MPVPPSARHREREATCDELRAGQAVLSGVRVALEKPSFNAHGNDLCAFADFGPASLALDARPLAALTGKRAGFFPADLSVESPPHLLLLCVRQREEGLGVPELVRRTRAGCAP